MKSRQKKYLSILAVLVVRHRQQRQSNKGKLWIRQRLLLHEHLGFRNTVCISFERDIIQSSFFFSAKAESAHPHGFSTEVHNMIWEEGVWQCCSLISSAGSNEGICTRGQIEYHLRPTKIEFVQSARRGSMQWSFTRPAINDKTILLHHIGRYRLVRPRPYTRLQTCVPGKGKKEKQYCVSVEIKNI